MTLYFDGYFGRREIGQPQCNRDVYAIITKFLEDRKYQSYYTRTWVNPNNPKEKWFDVGSHGDVLGRFYVRITYRIDKVYAFLKRYVRTVEFERRLFIACRNAYDKSGSAQNKRKDKDEGQD